MKKTIGKLRNYLFDLNINEYNALLNKILEIMEKSIVNLGPVKMNKCVSILSEALNALSNKDYLHCTDLIEYEIMPLLDEVSSSD